MNVRIWCSLAIMALFLSGCSRCSPRKKINEGGEVVGQTIGEFTEGVVSGVDDSFEIQASLSEELKTKGVTTGKIQTGTETNILVVYFIFTKDFSDTLQFKAFDNKGLEIGRVRQGVSGKKDDASYVEVVFDPHTRLQVDSKVTVE